jgi:hypothetical protein
VASRHKQQQQQGSRRADAARLLLVCNLMQGSSPRINGRQNEQTCYARAMSSLVLAALVPVLLSFGSPDRHPETPDPPDTLHTLHTWLPSLSG